MPNVAQRVSPAGHSKAPESLAPIPEDWATTTYVLTIIADPDDPALPMLAWAALTSGGEPVTSSGWGYDFGNNFGGGS